MELRELAADARLLVVVFLAGEDEVVVGDRGLARVDGVAAGDLVEGVDGERRGAVGGRQQVGVDAQRRAGHDVGVLVHAVRPDDLLGGGHRPRARSASGHTISGVRSTDERNSRRPTAKMPPLWRISSSFALSGTGVYVLPCVTLTSCARHGIEGELVAVLRVGHRLGALHDVQAEVERVAAEDVAHVVAADDHHLEAHLLGDRLEARGRHLARAADGEAVAGDDEGLARVHAGAEVGHQVAERPGLPALVQRVEALGHAVGRGRDLVGVDGVELLPGLRSGPRRSAPRRG